MDTQTLDLVRDISVTIIFAAIPPLLAQLFAWLSSRRQDERWKGAVDRLEKVVADAVDEVEQTFVKSAKADGGGTLTAEHQKAALRQAQAIVLQSLGEAGAKAVAARLGLNSNDLERRVKSMIEASVARRQR